jgi:hypothetical protein
VHSSSVRAGLTILALSTAVGGAALAVASAEADVLARLAKPRPYTLVPADVFRHLGWELPDGGAAVKAVADAAPGSAFDPRRLQELSPATVGYRASWHVVRYRYYGLDWDITGLLLTPRAPAPRLPTVALINGGSANWYEFFVDPLNGPAVAQYLAQRVPVLLVTVPGNYKPGGWTEPIPEPKAAYLLDQDVSDAEAAARNAIYTFSLVTEGVAQLIEKVTKGPMLISGHSTGGEIQSSFSSASPAGCADIRWAGALEARRRCGGRGTTGPQATGTGESAPCVPAPRAYCGRGRSRSTRAVMSGLSTLSGRGRRSRSRNAGSPAKAVAGLSSNRSSRTSSTREASSAATRSYRKSRMQSPRQN